MALQQHLFNRREVVALVLDLDDETLGRADYALPPPPSFKKSLSSFPTTPTNTNTAATAALMYVPPHTRLDVAREALIAFVSAKLRSAPASSAMSFGLYAVRGGGITTEDVLELVAPSAATGVTSGRAVQEALRKLNMGTFVYGSNANASAQLESPESATPYTGVLRSLKQLKDAAIQQQQARQAATSIPESPRTPVNTPRLTLNPSIASSNGVGTPTAIGTKTNSGEEVNNTKTDNSDASNTSCVVVHGIVVRSRSTPPPNLSEERADAAHSVSAEAKVNSQVWLDVVVLDDTLSTSKTAASNSSTNSTLSRESVMHGCRCAVLDPTELTGIRHRGLALGPALVRVMTLPETRDSAFVHRPLSFLKILRSTPTASSDAATAASASSSKSTPPQTTPVLSERVFTAVTATPVTVRNSSTPPQLQGYASTSEGGKGTAPTEVAAVASVVSAASRTDILPIASNSNALPTVSAKVSVSTPPANPRITLPSLSSGAGLRSGNNNNNNGPAAAAAAGVSPSSNNTSFRKEKSTVPRSPFPVMSPRSLSGASSVNQAQTVIMRQRDNTALRTNNNSDTANAAAARMQSMIDEGDDFSGKVSATTGSSGAHRYENTSLDTAVFTTTSNDHDNDKTLPVKAADAKRSSAAGPTPGLGGRSFENSTNGTAGPARRPSSSIFSHAAAAAATRHICTATTTQAPLSFAAERQQQQTTVSMGQFPPHTLFTPQPPPSAEAQATTPHLWEHGENAANPRKASGALSTYIQRSSPPSTMTGAPGRRLTASSPMHYALPANGGATRNAPSPSSRSKQLADLQNRTA